MTASDVIYNKIANSLIELLGDGEPGRIDGKNLQNMVSYVSDKQLEIIYKDILRKQDNPPIVLFKTVGLDLVGDSTVERWISGDISVGVPFYIPEGMLDNWRLHPEFLEFSSKHLSDGLQVSLRASHETVEVLGVPCRVAHLVPKFPSDFLYEYTAKVPKA